MNSNKYDFNEIIKFSHFFVVAFLRVESLHSFLNRKRDYQKYTHIPTLLDRYLRLKAEEEKIEHIKSEFGKLNKDLYKDVWNKISNIKVKKRNTNIEEYNSNNYITNINKLVNDSFEIEDKEFFSSIEMIYTKESKEEEDLDMLETTEELGNFFKNFSKINQELGKNHNNTDLKVCMLIISTEFSNFLHHIYIAYYRKYNKEDNIKKGVNHLKRANKDAEKALDLVPKLYSYASIMKRLQEINEVGM